MSLEGGTLFDLADQLRQQSPEHLDLFASLTDDQFQLAIDTLLNKAWSGLEEIKKGLQSLDEPTLSGVLRLAMLTPGLSVSLEQYSNGHADLTIESYRLGVARRILGEAKIHDGPRYHIDGVKQLLGYMTGRELRGLMVVYMRKANGSVLMKKIRDTMDDEKPADQQSLTTPHAIRWAFDSNHLHSCGDNIRVSHVACNLHVEGDSA
jgi:hypothetical protein